MNDASHDLRKGIYWFGLATAFARMADLVALVAVLALLSPRQLGIATAVRSIQAIVEALGGTGLGASVALVQAPKLSTAGLKGVFWYASAIGLLAMVVFLALTGPMATWFESDDVIALSLAASPRFLFMGAAVTPFAYLHREMRFRDAALVEAISAATAAITRAALALSGFGAWAIVVAHTVHGGALMVCSFIAARFWPSLKIAAAEVRAIARYGLSVTGALVGSVLQRNVDYLVIGRMLDVDTLGVYRAAFDVSSEPVQPIGDLAVRSGGPVFARVAQSKEKVAGAFRDLVKPISLLSTLVVAAIFCLCDEVMALMSEGRYVDGILCARLLLIASLGRIFFQLYQPVFEWTGSGKVGSALSMLSVASLTVALFLSIELGSERWGLAAIGLGWLAALPLPIVVGWRLQKRIFGMNLRPVLKALTPAMTAGFLAIAAGMGIGEVTSSLTVGHPIRLASQLLMVVLTYAVVLRACFNIRLWQIRPPKHQHLTAGNE